MALRHPSDARSGGLLESRNHLTARSRASTDRPVMLLSGTTQVKYPVLYEKEAEDVNNSTVVNANRIPRLACPDPVLSTAKAQNGRSYAQHCESLHWSKHRGIL